MTPPDGYHVQHGCDDCRHMVFGPFVDGENAYCLWPVPPRQPGETGADVEARLYAHPVQPLGICPQWESNAIEVSE